MIVVVDYGMGNCNSIVNMFRKVGANVCISNDPQTIATARGIVLPGVGSFDNGMRKLNQTGLLSHLEDAVLRRKVPFLGVCLGMHLLFNHSEEGRERGLGWVPGKVIKFNFSDAALAGLKVPHMGWNRAQMKSGSSFIDAVSADDDRRYYFVHSYHAVCENHSDILTTTTYGYEFVSAVERGNILGFQFHPEKSHRYGVQLFTKFHETVSNYA